MWFTCEARSPENFCYQINFKIVKGDGYRFQDIHRESGSNAAVLKVMEALRTYFPRLAFGARTTADLPKRPGLSMSAFSGTDHAGAQHEHTAEVSDEGDDGPSAFFLRRQQERLLLTAVVRQVAFLGPAVLQPGGAE